MYRLAYLDVTSWKRLSVYYTDLVTFRTEQILRPGRSFTCLESPICRVNAVTNNSNLKLEKCLFKRVARPGTVCALYGIGILFAYSGLQDQRTQPSSQPREGVSCNR